MKHDKAALVISALLLTLGIVLIPAVGVWGAITLTDRDDHEVLQEMVNGNGAPDTSRIRDVGITYTTTGVMTYDSVCWKLLNYTVDTVVDAGKFRETVTAGTYTDTIQDVPSPHVASIADTGAWYRIAVYGYTGADIDSSRGTNKWGVGLGAVLWGHSKWVFRNNGTFGHGPIATTDNAGLYVRKYDDWFPGAKISGDWMDTTNYGCDTCTSLVPQLVNRLVDSTHRLIGITGYAAGGSLLNPIGTALHYWRLRNAANPIDTSAVSGHIRLYGFLLRSALATKPLITIGYCGGNDAGNGTWQYDSIKKSYDSIFLWLDTDLGYNAQHFIIPENDYKYSTAYANGPILNIMEAQQDINGTRRYVVPHNYDMADHFPDYVHPGPVAHDTIAARTGNTIAQLINGNITTGYRGPYVTGSNVVSRGVVRLSFGLQTGRKLVMDSMVRVQVKSKYFDSIKNVSFALEPDSQSVKITIANRVMINDSIRIGFDREKSLLSIIRDNFGLPAERKAYLWYPITAGADSLAAATNRYWVGTGDDTAWTSVTAWSTTSGGAGGAGEPDSTCDVIIDSNNAKCVLMGASKCRSLFIAPTHTKYFKDRANTMGVECDFVYGAADSLLQSGTWSVKTGSWYTGALKVNNSTRTCKVLLKDDGMFITKQATQNYGVLSCAYPGKKTSVSCALVTGGSRVLHVMGGNFNVIDYYTISCDSSVTSMLDTVSGSTITGAGSLYMRASLYGTPATFSILGMTFGTALQFQQTRTEGAVTSIIQLGGALTQNTSTTTTSFVPAAGPAFKFLTNNNALSLSTPISIIFPATSTYQYYNFGTSTVTSLGFKTSGTIDKDTLAIGWNHTCGGSLILHGANIRVLLNNPTTTLNGTAADSIAVSGLSIGNVIINKSANGTKQVGVARYTDLTLTDGTFTQQSVTDTVQAVNAYINTADAVTNVAPWNISNKLTVGAGIKLTVPALIIGGSSGSLDSMMSATPGAMDTISCPQDTPAYVYTRDQYMVNPRYLPATSISGGNNRNVKTLSYTGVTKDIATGLTGETITFTGYGFVGDCWVKFGIDSSALIVNTYTSASATVPLGLAPGVYAVSVGNIDGDVASVGNFTVESGVTETPVISSIAPIWQKRGWTFKLRGTHFKSAQGSGTLYLGISDLLKAVTWTDTLIIDTIPASWSPKGTYNVIVKNSDSNRDTTQIRVLIPTITPGVP